MFRFMKSVATEQNWSEIALHGPLEIVMTAEEAKNSRPSTRKCAKMELDSVAHVLSSNREYVCNILHQIMIGKNTHFQCFRGPLRNDNNRDSIDKDTENESESVNRLMYHLD